MVGGQVKLDLLQGSRGLIFPVLWHEPFGLAVIESLYFGCPVYATPYGALPELAPPATGVLAAGRGRPADAPRQGGVQARVCHPDATPQLKPTPLGGASKRISPPGWGRGRPASGIADVYGLEGGDSLVWQRHAENHRSGVGRRGTVHDVGRESRRLCRGEG